MSEGFVYFIQEEESGRIKIGFSEKHPKGRLNDFQTGNSNKLNLLGYIEGTYEDESNLHREFNEERENGEWFKPSPRLKEKIKELLEDFHEEKKSGIEDLNLEYKEEERGKGVLYEGYVNGERNWYKNKNEKIDGDYIYNEGDGVYVGEFKGGVPDGRGELKYPLFPDGEKYFGEWKDGEYHGQGTYSNGEEKYVGEWKNGKKHGQGTYSNVDRKDEEKGEWKDGVLWNGHRTLKHYTDMSSHFKVDTNFVYQGQYVGEIKYGERWNGTFYDEDGNISKKYVNGEYTDLDPTRNEPIEKKRGWWNILK